MILEVPVSVGEFIDKVTILDIKLCKIKDNRKNEVRKEYDLLYSKLSSFIEKYKFYYDILKDINLTIWEMQDLIREKKDNMNANEYHNLCMKILDENDRRFRVKNKINILSDSSIKEQKGYNLSSCLILINYNYDHVINMIPSIRYYSTIYDIVYVPILKQYKNSIEMLLNEDSSIILILLDEEYYGHIPDLIKLPSNINIIKSGLHIGNKEQNNYLSFYDDLGLSHDIYHKYH